MKDKTRQDLHDRVYAAVREMNVRLPDDVARAIRQAAETETGPGAAVLRAILQNLETGAEARLPSCQDPGRGIGFAERGEDVPPANIRATLDAAVAKAYADGSFRPSVVEDPLANRTNTGTSLPLIYHWDVVPGRRLKIDLLAKGFGSENCSRTIMLKPTAGRQAVVEAVCATVRDAGGAPCPPVVLGVGIGSTLDGAARLSKKALTRRLDDRHPDTFYADLEADAIAAVNALGIGPGGLGGRHTALACKIETGATHIAGLPVAVSVNCWADRRACVVMEDAL